MSQKNLEVARRLLKTWNSADWAGRIVQAVGYPDHREPLEAVWLRE